MLSRCRGESGFTRYSILSLCHGRKGLLCWEFMQEQGPCICKVIRETDCGSTVLDDISEVLIGRNGCQGSKAVTETFNKIYIFEAKDRLLSFISGSFECWDLGGSISKWNRYVEGFNIAAVAENGYIVACGAAVCQVASCQEWVVLIFDVLTTDLYEGVLLCLFWMELVEQ